MVAVPALEGSSVWFPGARPQLPVMCSLSGRRGRNPLPKAEHVRGETSPVLQDLQMTQMVKLSIVHGSRKLSTQQQISMQEHPEMRQLNLSSPPPTFSFLKYRHDFQHLRFVNKDLGWRVTNSKVPGAKTLAFSR